MDFEQFRFYSKFRQDIRIFSSYALYQYAPSISMRMLNMRILLLRVSSAEAYCY